MDERIVAGLPERVKPTREALAQARRETRELRAIIDAAPIGILIRRGPTIVYANRAVAALDHLWRYARWRQRRGLA